MTKKKAPDVGALYAQFEKDLTLQERLRRTPGDGLRQEAADRLDELEQSFDLRWKADMRAIKRWQAEAPGRELTWPDHADLVVWLIGRLARLEGPAAEKNIRLLRRDEAAKYVRSKGLACSPKTLAKIAVTGGGPQFSKWGRYPLYATADLDAWIAERMTGRFRSTSEMTVAAAKEAKSVG